jgi:hypothetical protein
VTCSTVKLPGGGTAIVCGPRGRRRRCSVGGCTASAALLCDWKIGDGKTCDAPICREHAEEVAPDKHLCRRHQVDYRDWLKRRAAL